MHCRSGHSASTICNPVLPLEGRGCCGWCTSQKFLLVDADPCAHAAQAQSCVCVGVARSLHSAAACGACLARVGHLTPTDACAAMQPGTTAYWLYPIVLKLLRACHHPLRLWSLVRASPRVTNPSSSALIHLHFHCHRSVRLTAVGFRGQAATARRLHLPWQLTHVQHCPICCSRAASACFPLEFGRHQAHPACLWRRRPRYAKHGLVSCCARRAAVQRSAQICADRKCSVRWAHGHLKRQQSLARARMPCSCALSACVQQATRPRWTRAQASAQAMIVPMRLRAGSRAPQGRRTPAGGGPPVPRRRRARRGDDNQARRRADEARGGRPAAEHVQPEEAVQGDNQERQAHRRPQGAPMHCLEVP
jgi:hypothetical protein